MKSKLLLEIYFWASGAIVLAVILGGTLFSITQNVMVDVSSKGLRLDATSNEPPFIKVAIIIGFYITVILLAVIARVKFGGKIRKLLK